MSEKLSSHIMAGILAILLLPAKILYFVYQDVNPKGGKVDLEIQLEVEN